MNPQLAAKLMSDVPEMTEFVEFVVREAGKLNSIEDMRGGAKTDEELGAEVRARHYAYEKLTSILAPLLNTQAAHIGANPQDYVV